MPRRFKNGIDLDGQRGRRFGTPTAADDAATKGYVDGVADYSGFVSGRSYLPIGHGALLGGLTNVVANQASLIYGGIKKTVSIASIGERVTTPQSGGLFQIAVYRHNPLTGGPGALVFSTDSLSAATADQVNATLAQAQLLEMGGYWFASNQNVANIAFMAQAVTSPHFWSLVGAQSAVIPVSTANGSQANCYTTNLNFGTWPSDLSSTTLSIGPPGRAPMVQFMVS